MPKDVQLLAEAVDEAQAAAEWYTARSPRAAAGFQRELSRAMQAIQENPSLHPSYLHGTRFYRLRRFPFLAVFREKEHVIEVIAIAHGHRKAGYWKRRLG